LSCRSQSRLAAGLKLAGKPLARVDLDIVTRARTVSTRSFRLVCAAIACARFRRARSSADEAPARGRRGVLRVLAMDEFVAVIG
jgi:hypothetical protein